MKRRFSPKQYAERLRRQRRRLYLQDGVLSVRFIKFINEQPPAVGAALPEPKPELPPDSAKCIGCYAIFTRGFKSVEGTGFCDDCIRALCPQPEPQTAEDWARGISLGGITPPWPGGAA